MIACTFYLSQITIEDQMINLSGRVYTCDWYGIGLTPYLSSIIFGHSSWNQPLDGQPYSNRVHTSDGDPNSTIGPPSSSRLIALRNMDYSQIKRKQTKQGLGLLSLAFHNLISSFHFVRSLTHLWTSEHSEHLQTERLASGYPDISSRAGFRPNSFCLCKIPGK